MIRLLNVKSAHSVRYVNHNTDDDKFIGCCTQRSFLTFLFLRFDSILVKSKTVKKRTRLKKKTLQETFAARCYQKN